MASNTGFIIAVVLLLTQHVWMKPTQVSKDIVQGNNFEKELEAEAQNPTYVEHADSQQDKDASVGEWGDVVDGIDVGNVIKDVLLTLRDHPEIVRKLIEDEEKSLAEKVLSSERDMVLETPEDDDELLLSDEIPTRDFQLPSPQLHQAPKRVVKKMGSYKYEKQKREQETPEETIDMTYPVEGGSDEMDLKQQNDDDSGDTVQPKDIKTGHLEEVGSAKPVFSGTDGVKRRYSSEIDNDNSDESTSSNEPSNTESSESDESNEQIWKAYKDRKQKENKGQQKGKQDNRQKLSKSEYWKQYGKDKNYRKHSKDIKNDSEEDTSKSNVWKNYIKNKEEKSKETSEDISDSNDVDSPELDTSSHNQDGRGTDKKDIDENELYQLTKQKNVVM